MNIVPFGMLGAFDGQAVRQLVLILGGTIRQKTD